VPAPAPPGRPFPRLRFCVNERAPRRACARVRVGLEDARLRALFLCLRALSAARPIAARHCDDLKAKPSMPKRTDISSILIIGAGPIVIGQACEFDYSGTQACKALKAEGYRIVLVNSNPATIMTDPDLADATYIEPITPEIVAKIIAKERYAIPGGFALLPTMGGQTALNTALSLRRMGTLEKYDVQMIGATAEA